MELALGLSVGLSILMILIWITVSVVLAVYYIKINKVRASAMVISNAMAGY